MLKSTVLLAGLQLLAAVACAQNLVFSADAALALINTVEAVADAEVRKFDAAEVSGDDCPDPVPALARQKLIPVGTFPRTCACSTPKTVVVDDIRDISDTFCANGNTKSLAGLSNMIWGFGQFLDHDLALSIENETSPVIEVETETDVMDLHRTVTTCRGGCKNTLNVHTHLIDAGPVYGSEEAYVQSTLREPDTCLLRTVDGNFLPLTTSANEEGRFFMIAGDVRVSEHAFLAAQHTVWVREHNRICGDVEADPAHARMSADAKFDLVRNVVIAKFQQVVLTEFLPALGITQTDLETATSKINLKGVSVEFSIAYRLGHDFIPNDVGGIDMANAFGSEKFFLDKSGTDVAPSVVYRSDAEANITSIMTNLATTSANEIDGKLSDALRNFLFGRSDGEDLAGRNIFRGRELGLPTYAGLADCFGLPHDAMVEAETPDPWLGLLREPKAAGTPIPATLRAIIVEQFHRSFFAPGGFYWKTHMRQVGRFADEIENSTYGKIISANSGAKVTGDVFKVKRT